MIRNAATIACTVLLACDVSTPTRFRPDGGPGSCPLILNGDRLPLVDSSCGHLRCRGAAIESGCAFSVSIEECESSELAGTVLDDGSIRLELKNEASVCTSIEKAPGAYFSASCEGQSLTCRYDVYPAQTNAFAGTRAISLLQAEFKAPPGNGREPLSSPFATLRGYFGGAGEVDGGIVVTTFDGRFDGIDCTDEAPTRTFYIGLPAFTVLDQWVTPPCLTRVFTGGQGDFIGVFGGRRPMLGRFLLNGTLTSSRAISGSSATPWISGLTIDHDHQRIYVLWTSDEIEFGGAGLVTIHDLFTFAPLASSNELSSLVLSLDFTRRGDIAVASRGDRRVEFFDGEDAQLLGGSYLSMVNRALSDQPGAIALHKLSGLLLVSTVGIRPGILVLDPERERPIVNSALDFVAGGSVGALALYRAELNWMIAGLTDDPPMYRARAVRFDPLAGRFLPGFVELGRGAVSGIFRMSESNDMVAVLPWSAEVVRLSVE